MLYRTLRRIERNAAFYLGKGYGAATLKKEVQQATKLLGHPARLCVDIGGNKGLYTQELLAAAPDTTVVIFEPAAVNITGLRERFDHDPRVSVEPYAVSRETGEAVLFTNEPGSGLASLTKRRLDHHDIDMSTEETIQVVRFEDYWSRTLDRASIDICKIDVEGHELDVLSGFGDALSNTEVIQFEFGGCNIDTRTYFQDFWYFFEAAGFDLYRITPFGVNRVNAYSEREESFTTTNYLARRRM